jgi:glycosyltransferase involved in cell wall biosynthesis
VVLFLTFHVLAPLIFFAHCIRRHKRFDLVQAAGDITFLSDISYAHFCHAAFLKKHWKAVRNRSARSVVQWLHHFLAARIEKFIYGRVDKIVVPSEGLARELASEYPFCAGKIVVIPNPIDAHCLHRPDDQSKEILRKSMGFTASELVLVFVALGHFERKGLPLLLECLQRGHGVEWKLLVVGGLPGLINIYRRKAAARGASGRIVFVGHQQDVRPFLWAADAFVLPSHYETFSLVSFQAAAAGLPVIASRLHGVEDFLEDGANGFCVERDPKSLTEAIERVARLSPSERAAMGVRAQTKVAKYDTKFFAKNWRAFYEDAFAAPCGGNA